MHCMLKFRESRLFRLLLLQVFVGIRGRGGSPVGRCRRGGATTITSAAPLPPPKSPATPRRLGQGSSTFRRT